MGGTRLDIKHMQRCTVSQSSYSTLAEYEITIVHDMKDMQCCTVSQPRNCSSVKTEVNSLNNRMYYQYCCTVAPSELKHQLQRSASSR